MSNKGRAIYAVALRLSDNQFFYRGTQMQRTKVNEVYIDDYQDEYLLFKYISDLAREIPAYGRVVVTIHIESVEPVRVRKEKP